FDLTDTQSGMLLPFEGLGVDSSWEFVMPKAANPFAYSTIADILLAVDYTAFDSPDYRSQIIQQQDQTMNADRSYSFVQQFPDQWYALSNPDPVATRVSVSFQTMTNDFPPNVSNIEIGQLLMYFAPAQGTPTDVMVSGLEFTPQGSTLPIAGGA